MASIEKCKCGGLKIPKKCKCDGHAIGYVDIINKNPDVPPLSRHIYCCEECCQLHGDNFVKFDEGYYCELIREPHLCVKDENEIMKQCDICYKLLWEINEDAYSPKKCPKSENFEGMRHVYKLPLREDLDLCRSCCTKHGGSSENKTCNYIDFHKEHNVCLNNMVKKCQKIERKVPRLKRKIEEERTKRGQVQLELAKERIRIELIKQELLELKAKSDKFDD